MKKKKIKNPLIRRIPRELLGDWKKYLVVALFLILTIGFVSGMYVANESMLVAANEGVIKYKLEDGHFELDKKADETLLFSFSVSSGYGRPLTKQKKSWTKSLMRRLTRKPTTRRGIKL